MYCPLCRIPAFRRLRSRLARIFAFGVLTLLVHGCDQPTAPTEDPAPGLANETDLASVGLASLANNRIAFQCYAAEEGDICTITPSGGGLTRLTSFAGSEWDPSWSYDHQRLAFVRWRKDPYGAERGDIFIMNADGSNKHWARSTASNNFLSEPSWSPDGKRLVLTLQLTGGGTMYLATLDLSTGTLAWVAPSGAIAVAGRGASWDPTGTAITYIDLTGHAVHRFVPGGKDEILLTATSNTWIDDAILSPDGTRLAYTLSSSSTQDVYVRNLATKTNKRLTSNPAHDQSPSWSPDGYRISFISNRSAGYQVWSMSAATGSNLVQVTKVGGAEKPAWRH